MAADNTAQPDTDDIRSLSINADRYERLECIGRGSFGDVYKGLDKESDMEVAIKVIDLEDVEDDIEDIHKEVAVLAKCRSENITEYYASVLKPGSSELFIVMELMAASVADLLDDRPLEEPLIAHILRQVLHALVYLHGEQRVHRDIKAANVLLSAEGAVKISDFGVSGQLTGTLGYRRRTFVGTPFWMPPEVIETSEEGYTQTADIWSLGITAIEMATGTPPLAELHPMRALFLIPKNPAPRLEGPFSQPLCNFVARCLAKDPALRPSAQELLEDEFVRDAPLPDLLKQRVAQHFAQQKPIAASKRSRMMEAQLTLPKWDFGRLEHKAGTIKAARHMQTLKNHQISTLTMKGPTMLGTPPLDSKHPQQLGVNDMHKDVESIQESVRGSQQMDADLSSGKEQRQDEPAAVRPASNGDAAAFESYKSRAEPHQATAEQPSSSKGPPATAKAEALKAQMEHALAAAGVSKQEAAQRAAALSAIASLDEQQPGSLQRMLEQMAQQKSVEAGASASEHRQAGSYLGRVVSQEQQGTQQEPRPEVALDLGPLGNFLLARWRESIEQDIDPASPWSDIRYH